MIYCKSLEKGYFEVLVREEEHVVLREIAALLSRIHLDAWGENTRKAREFREIMQKMVQEDSATWQIYGENLEELDPMEGSRNQVSTHYDHLCISANHFGLDAQKQKTKEEMDELAELLGDYSLPDQALRAARIEELADVYNMLDQLCILWDCEDEVRDTAERKMERTMERIASGYYEGKSNG